MTRDLLNESKKFLNFSNLSQNEPTSPIRQRSSPSQISRSRTPTSSLQAIEYIKSMACRQLAWQTSKSWIFCCTIAMKTPSLRLNTRCRIIVRWNISHKCIYPMTISKWKLFHSLTEQPLCDDEARTSDHRTWERMSRLDSSWWVRDADHCDIGEAVRAGLQDESHQARRSGVARRQCKFEINSMPAPNEIQTLFFIHRKTRRFHSTINHSLKHNRS